MDKFPRQSLVHRRPPWHRRRHWRLACLLCCIVGSAAVASFAVSHSSVILYSLEDPLRADGLGTRSPPLFPQVSNDSGVGISPVAPASSSFSLVFPTAQEIVQRSFRETFGSLPSFVSPECDSSGEWKSCLRLLRSEAREISLSSQTAAANATARDDDGGAPPSAEEAAAPTSSTRKSFPWWFQSLLRDTTSPGLNGRWHNMSSLHPPVDFCTIEKIGTTQWRKVFCLINEGNYSSPSLPCYMSEEGGKERLDLWRGEQREREAGGNGSGDRAVARAVVLRDPLERLLSAFLDKCVHPRTQLDSLHCGPSAVFRNEKVKGTKEDLTKTIRDEPKQLFAAYLDVFPLKWNMHFFPQSLYCDGLFRHINNYDFVGKMDKHFYSSLDRMSTQLGGSEGNGGVGAKYSLPEALEHVFNLRQSRISRGENNTGKQTRAAAHVNKYYTADSVRRALQLFAVDYVTLGLEVPEWVHGILDDERTRFAAI